MNAHVGLSSSMLRSTFGAVALAAALTSTSPSRAQTEDKAGAEALLRDALALEEAGEWAKACTKLEESFRRYSSHDTEYRLGECHERVGKIASAWIDYIGVELKARSSGEHAKADQAKGRADALEPQVPMLTLEVSVATPGLRVTRDGALVGRGQWGSAAPIDPGEYRFATVERGACRCPTP